MLRKVAPVDPVTPEVRGPLDAVEGLGGVLRRGALGPELRGVRPVRARPADGGEGALTLLQGLGGVRTRPFEADPEVGDQPQGNVAFPAGRDRLPVATVGVLPARAGLPVVEDRLAVEADLDRADDAAGRPEEDVLGLGVGRRAAMGPRAAL